MADVFVSYAQEDQAQVAVLTKALEAAGYSVWWDQRLSPGADYHDVIEREIEQAACVVVVWSDASRESRAVRAEAGEGLERGILVPVRIEDVKPPLLFRAVQYEELIGWTGDARAEPFRRLLIQIAALVSGQEAAQTADEPRSAAPYDRRAPKRGDAETAAGVFRTPGSILTLLAILGGAAALFVQPERFLGDYWALVVGLAALAVTLFQFAERDLSAPTKAIARRWLAPRPGGVKISGAEAFQHLFEAVFGRRHFSFDGFVRSAIASFIFFVVAFALLYKQPIYDLPPNFLIAIFLFAGIANILGDYISLYETRILLRLVKNNGNLALIALLDLALTTLVYAAATALSIIATTWFTGDTDPVARLAELGPQVAALITGAIAALFGGPAPAAGWDAAPTAVILASFITTYLTSIWLWLSLLFTPLFRLVALGASSQETLVGRFFNFHSAPIAALGYLTAAMILALGGAVWAIRVVVAA